MKGRVKRVHSVKPLSSDVYFYCTSRRMTLIIGTTGDTITDAAPIARRFIGQPVGHIDNWMRKMGGYVRKPI